MSETERKNTQEGRPSPVFDRAIYRTMALGVLWAGGLYLSVGARTTLMWAILLAVFLAVSQIWKNRTSNIAQPNEGRASAAKKDTVRKPSRAKQILLKGPLARYFLQTPSPSQVLMGVALHCIWAAAPFLIYQSQDSGRNLVAVSMVGIGMIQVIREYRQYPKLAALICVPYLALMGLFLFDVRGEDNFALTVIGALMFLLVCVDLLSSQRAVKSALIEYDREQESLKDDLIKTRDLAHKSDRDKSNFLAYISHELRTPLNAIMGLSEIVLKEELSGSQRHKISLIKDSGQGLTALLNDLLDLSKLNANRLTLKDEIVSMATEFQNHFDFWHAAAFEKDINLVYRKQKDFPDHIKLDYHRLRQCMNNLLSNAIKFSRPGGDVIVSLAGQPMPPSSKNTLSNSPVKDYLVEITVQDTGIGMDTDQVKRLFRAYEQGSDGHASQYGGTGLGLLITRELARRMGGNVQVQSELGQGSVFKIRVGAFCDGIEGEQSVPAVPVEASVEKKNLTVYPDVETGKNVNQNKDQVFDRDLSVKLSDGSIVKSA